MGRPLAIAVAVALAAAAASAAAADTASKYRSTVSQILAQPYQPQYVPQGCGTAFPPGSVLNTAPAQDYTSGSIPGSLDAPPWPAWFRPVQFKSGDGAPLLGELALHSDDAPGVVVVHGFNTHGYASVIRWAAMLYANGYDVLAADQRDFSFEHDAGFGYPAWQQTFGWKESEDVLAAGRYLAAQRGTKDIGVVGFSEGGQNTVLVLVRVRPRRRASVQGRHPVQRPRRPEHADLFDRSAVRLRDTVLHVSGDRRARAARRAAVRQLQRVRGADARRNALRHRRIRDPRARDRVSRAAACEGGATQRLLGRRFPRARVRGRDDGRRGRQRVAADSRGDERRACLLLRPLVATARDPPLLQGSPSAATGSAKVTSTPTVNQTSGGPAFGEQLVPIAANNASADAHLAPYACETSRGRPRAS
jgi:dienelactone hydrolase